MTAGYYVPESSFYDLIFHLNEKKNQSGPQIKTHF